MFIFTGGNEEKSENPLFFDHYLPADKVREARRLSNCAVIGHIYPFSEEKKLKIMDEQKNSEVESATSSSSPEDSSSVSSHEEHEPNEQKNTEPSENGQLYKRQISTTSYEAPILRQISNNPQFNSQISHLSGESQKSRSTRTVSSRSSIVLINMDEAATLNWKVRSQL